MLPFEWEPLPFALVSFVSAPVATCRLKGWAVEVVAGDGGAEDEACMRQTGGVFSFQCSLKINKDNLDKLLFCRPQLSNL